MRPGTVKMAGNLQSCGAESRGAEIKLPPEAGAEITNCGPGSIKDLEKFYRKKSWLLKKFLEIITILILFGYNMHQSM